jgi:hypothetical protein
LAVYFFDFTVPLETKKPRKPTPNSPDRLADLQKNLGQPETPSEEMRKEEAPPMTRIDANENY